LNELGGKLGGIIRKTLEKMRKKIGFDWADKGKFELFELKIINF